jgi:hypothetical protein
VWDHRLNQGISLQSNHKIIRFSRRRAALFATAAVLVGIVSVIVIYASTSPVAFEAETGTLTGPAAMTSPAGASGGAAVKFGSAVTSGFTHPGILNSTASLDFTKNKIAAGAQPWLNIYNNMKSSSITQASYQATPVAILDCGGNNTGCTNLETDSEAAYADALIWYYSGDRAYAQKSIQIINAWSNTLTSSTTFSQNNLYAAWAAETYPRAAEILRYLYTPSGSETALDITKFTTMMTQVWQPLLGPDTAEMKSSNGNWDLSMADGLINIAVFTNDRSLYTTALTRWRDRTPSYLYASTDNASNGLPIAPPGGLYNTAQKLKCFWLDSGSPSSTCDTSNFYLANGQTQETCRDYVHVGLGVASIFDEAETAYLQGTDLYGEQKGRLAGALEYNSAIMNAQSYPADICKGAVSPLKAIVTVATYSIGYNALAGRLHMSLPATAQVVARAQAGNTFGGFRGSHMLWEALTHTGTP